MLGHLLLVVNVQHVLRVPHEKLLSPAKHELGQFGKLPFWQLPQVGEVQIFVCAAQVIAVRQHVAHESSSRLHHSMIPARTHAVSGMRMVATNGVGQCCWNVMLLKLQHYDVSDAQVREQRLRALLSACLFVEACDTLHVHMQCQECSWSPPMVWGIVVGMSCC